MKPSLTATEARVAGLVAEGRTNEEIAEVLALRPSSVEGHLLRACEKLGIRTRTELAVMLTASSGPIGNPRDWRRTS
jgi:DNA-binding CsgD family transcriptional regulator